MSPSWARHMANAVLLVALLLPVDALAAGLEVELARPAGEAADRAAALAAHEQALRDRAAARAGRTRGLVLNGEFSEVAAGRKEIAGLPVTRERLEDVIRRAYRQELGAYALLFAESAYNVRDRFVEAVDQVTEAEVGSVPAWWDGRAPAGARRIRATDESIEERPWYTTDGPLWAPYWEVVGPRRDVVIAALEAFVEDGGLLVVEDEHCGEEPLAGLLPLTCEEQEDPARLDLRPADGSAPPERVTVRSALWHRIAAIEPDAVCQPLAVAPDRRRWPQPLAVRCDRPLGGVTMFTSFHADDLARDGALSHALYGGGEAPSALEAALIDAPLSGPALQAIRADGSIVTPTVVDRGAMRLGGAPAASAKAPRTSVGIYVDEGEHGYVQVGFREGPVRAELRSPGGALVAVREAATAPLLLDLMGRPRGLYELRLSGDKASAIVTVQHLSTVPRERWTGASAAAWSAHSDDALVVDGFTRGAAGVSTSALEQLRAEATTLARLAMGDQGAALLVIEGHASVEGSSGANARLSLRRALWAAGVVASAAEASSGTPCTVKGEACARWVSRLSRRPPRGMETVAVEFRFGAARLRLALRPLGSTTPVEACGPRDEACHLKNRRVVVRLEQH